MTWLFINNREIETKAAVVSASSSHHFTDRETETEGLEAI